MVATVLHPNSFHELVDVVRDSESIRIAGLNSQASNRPVCAAAVHVELFGLTGIVSYRPQDQVIVVRSGMPLTDFAAQMEADGFQIPGNGFGTLGGSISMGDLESSTGPTWRDSILGMHVVLADGRIVKFGSRAVKNVAGYDGHKLFIGARGTLGVIADVFLRLTPGPSQSACERSPQIISEVTDPTVIKYMRRAKDLFDPTHKLNPGEMGIF